MTTTTPQRRTIVRYAGPRPSELPEMMDYQRGVHRAMMAEIKVVRACPLCSEGEKAAQIARHLMDAKLARLHLQHLKACEHALATKWRDRQWMYTDEQENP